MRKLLLTTATFALVAGTAFAAEEPAFTAKLASLVEQAEQEACSGIRDELDHIICQLEFGNVTAKVKVIGIKISALPFGVIGGANSEDLKADINGDFDEIQTELDRLLAKYGTK